MHCVHVRACNNNCHELASKPHRGNINSSNKVLYKLLNRDNNLSQNNHAYKMASVYVLIL